jgi:hypothetical protein
MPVVVDSVWIPFQRLWIRDATIVDVAHHGGCVVHVIRFPPPKKNNEGAMTETKTKAIEDNRCAGWSLVTTACKGEERPSGLAEGNVVSGYGGNRLLLARFGFITK